MLHRTTWIAIPVVAVVVAGAGLGWWGYDQQQQRQTMAIQTENQYESSFHSLVSDMNILHQELGKAMISSDVSAFQSRLRNVWRLSYAAQIEVGRLPFSLMPMHNTQTFLSTMSANADRWMETSAPPTNPDVRGRLTTYYKQSQTLSNSLARLQPQVIEHRLPWVNVNQTLKDGKGDNQVIDGFRKMDTAASAFVESSDKPSSVHRGRTLALRSEDPITARQAVSALGEFLGVARTRAWDVTETKPGAYVQEYTINGDTPLGSMYGVVSKHGGHVLSFHMNHFAQRGTFDFADAGDRAEKWLRTRGFGAVEQLSANQFDHTAYFVYAPLDRGIPVVTQSMSVKVALDNGQVIGYDGSNYFYYPVRKVPTRVYSVATLQRKLSPDFSVQMSREVIAVDKQNLYQPAVAFYGISKGETYRVYMNAHTGKEMSIEQLTQH